MQAATTPLAVQIERLAKERAEIEENLLTLEVSASLSDGKIPIFDRKSCFYAYIFY